MRIVDWILSNPDDALALVGFAAGVFGLKRRSDGQDKNRERLASMLRTEVYRVLGKPELHASVEIELRGAVRVAGSKLGLPDKVSDRLAAHLIEEALELFYQELFSRQLGDVAKQSREIADSIPAQGSR
jgi:hypothetical protein